jgi:predicted aspartyl protease
MGEVYTEAKLENLADIFAVKSGQLSAECIRTIIVLQALVDTGATLLTLPISMILQLGLTRFETRKMKTTNGDREAGIYGAVRLTIQGRSCILDVAEAPDNIPVLIGQIPLEHLDFLIDPRKQILVGNPDHGGEHCYESY